MPSITALLPVPAAAGLDLLCRQAEAFGAAVSRSSSGAEISAELGRIEARAEAERLRLVLTSETPEELAGLRGAVDMAAASAGIPAPGWEGVSRAKSRLIAARLTECRQLSPSFLRIGLSGDFAAFANGGLHFRLLIGPEGAPAPEADPGGSIDWPGGIGLWHRPPYTVRSISADAARIEFDVFVHEGGRAAPWLRSLAPGAPVFLAGPGGRGIRNAPWLGLIGDETALPVILRAIGSAPAGVQGQAMILLGDAADRQEIIPPPGLRLDWMVRSGGTDLVSLLGRLHPPEEGRFVFFAGGRQEAAAARIRLEAMGLAAGEYHAAAYWTEDWQPPAGQWRPPAT